MFHNTKNKEVIAEIAKMIVTIHPPLDADRLRPLEPVANFNPVPMKELKIFSPFLALREQGSKRLLPMS